MNKPWHIVSNIADIPSPALLVYPDRIRENVRRALAIVGDPARLRSATTPRAAAARKPAAAHRYPDVESWLETQNRSVAVPALVFTAK